MNLNVVFARPTTRTDGSALPLAAVANLRLYRSVNGGPRELFLNNSPSNTSTLLEDVPPGSYVFDMTAVDTQGQESAPTPSKSVTVPAPLPAPPSPPTGFNVTTA